MSLVVMAERGILSEGVRVAEEQGPKDDDVPLLLLGANG